MATVRVDGDILKAAVYGGSVLGGGGGGKIEDGLQRGLLALKRANIKIIDIDDIDPFSVLLTVSSVGAPAARNRYLEPDYYVHSVEILLNNIDFSIDGFISSENGAASTVNGWLQSAAMGIPIVDAPCNGRAHPIGAMGSMGLGQSSNYISQQAVVGGSREKGTYIELYTQCSLHNAEEVVRRTANLAGGVVALARNPVSARFVRENAAPGAIKYAIRIGNAMLSRKESPERMIRDVASLMGGDIIGPAEVEKVQLETIDALDVGKVALKSEREEYEIIFLNEYLTLESRGKRIMTFPDLITTMDVKTGLPICSAELREGHKVAILTVHRSKLLLGRGIFLPQFYTILEEYTQKDLIKYCS